jgi:hypothetical protein
MITFACSACGKSLKIADELAGKRVKCPGCGQLTAVGPARLPSKHVADEPTLTPSHPPDATAGDGDGDAPDDPRDLTSFLAPPQSPDEIGRLGEYRILKVLGAGGMGVVFKAEDPGLERLVAIKAMLPSMAASKGGRQRFLREAKAAAAIKHDHIVTIHQVGEDRGAPFLAMEFLEGEPLDARLTREGMLPPSEVCVLGRQIAEGLAAAHERGLIHRDIKPGNVWLETLRNRVKILDFGLARSVGDTAHITQSGAIIGTPAYMAPEQAMGKSVDHRCDLFSLGCLLYRASTGELPFKGSDTLSTLSALAMQTPRPPREVNPKVPAALSDLIARLLAKDPDERPASAREVAAALEQMQSHEMTTVRPGGERKPAAATQTLAAPRSPASRHKVWIGLALGVLAAAVACIIFFTQTPEGTVRIGIDDPAFEVTLTPTGTTVKGADTHEVKLEPGEHGLTIRRGAFEFHTEKFILKKGNTITLKVELLGGRARVVQGDRVIGEGSVADYALAFDGEGGVCVPTLARDTQTPVTLECWCDLDAKNQYRAVLVLGGKEWFGIAHNPRGGCYLVTERIPQNTARPTSPLRAGKWAHLAAVADGREGRLYLDGKLQVRESLLDSAVPHPRPPDGKLILGATLYGANLGSTMTGQLREVRVSRSARYNADFTPPDRFTADQDTLALYHIDEGQGDQLLDSSGNNHHGRIMGARWVRAESSVNPPGAYDKPEDATAPTGATIKPDEGWVDLFPLLDLNKDAHNLHPQSARVKEGLYLKPAAGARLVVPLLARGSYELRLEFTEKSGKPVSLTYPVAGTKGYLFLTSDSISVDMKRIVPVALEQPAGERRTVNLRVRTDGDQGKVEAEVNGKAIIRWEGPGSEWGRDVLGRPDELALRLGTAEVTLHSLKMRMLDGETKLHRPLATVYLDDLDEKARSTFQTMGKHGYDHTGKFKLFWKSINPKHALATHPFGDKGAFVEYDLGGRHGSFLGTAAISDGVKPSTTPLTFRVQGDGKELWRSAPLQAPRESAKFNIDVRGVKVLRLEVQCPGTNDGAQAVWIEPRLFPAE